MADRIYLHIGVMKSATTYLQSLFDANAAAFEEHGILWPGSRLNFASVGDLLGRHGNRRVGAWQQLVDAVSAHHGAVLISNELLSIRRGPAARTLAEHLDAPIDVIITARDLLRVIPAQWSTGVENGRPTPWPEFIGALVDDERRHPDVHRFWRRQDLPGIVRAWAPISTGGRVRMVTVPGPGGGPDVIAQRFLSALGVDPAAFENPSPKPPRRDIDVPSIPLTDEQTAWARARAHAMVRRLQRMPVELVGDWSDLQP